jgi:hypothetical protein
MSEQDPTRLLPFEFYILQHLYHRKGIWREDDLTEGLVRWTKSDPCHADWVRLRVGVGTDIRGLLGEKVRHFLYTVANPWEAHQYAEAHFDRDIAQIQKRLGMERLAWQHDALLDHLSRYYSANEKSRKLQQLMEFRFAGQRAGSELHQRVVTEYAQILQARGRFVEVDTGAVESKLPDIRVRFPCGPLQWNETDRAAVEVEIEAHRKSDEAILRNLRKQTGPVRFVVLDERDCERVSKVIMEATGSSPKRVENYPGMFDRLEIEVVTSQQPLREFLRENKGPGADEAQTRLLYEDSRYPKKMSRREREEAESTERWDEARKLAEEGDDFQLSMVRRAEYMKKVAEEDRQWFEAQARKGHHPRVRPRRKWPKPDTESN